MSRLMTRRLSRRTPVSPPLLLPVGVGMTAYGAAYFGFHDVVVHRRLSHRYRPASRYMQRLRDRLLADGRASAQPPARGMEG